MFFIKSKKERVAAAFVILLVFFFILIWQSNPYPQLPSSPDGVANITFAEKIANGKYPEEIISDDIPDNLKPFLIPRSTKFNSERSSIQPISYYGWPVLMSLLIKITQLWFSYLVIIFLGGIAVYNILRLLGKSEILSFLGTIIFSFNPIILYYIPLGHMHNLFFLVLLLCSVWSLLYFIKKEKVLFLITSGILFGFSAATRTNEIFWMSILLIIPVVYYWGTIKNKIIGIVLWVFGAVISFTPFTFFTYFNSGSITQYRNTSSDAMAASSSILNTIKSYVFPFGVDFGLSINSFYSFALEIWWIVIPAVFAIIYLVIVNIIRKRYKILVVLLFLLLISFYLLLYYGPSSKVYPEELQIDYSHFRYLLPVFSLLPLGLIFFNSYKKTLHKSILITFIVVTSFLSFSYAINSKAGLVNYRVQNQISHEKNIQVLSLTKENSIILSGKADKNFFPDRVVSGEVMHRYREDFVEELTNSRLSRDVYYYFVEANISSHWTKEALEKAGVTFEYVTQFWDGGNAWEYLYKLDWPNKDGNNERTTQ